MIEMMAVIKVIGNCKCSSLQCDLCNAKHLTASLQKTVILNVFTALLLLLQLLLLLGGLNVVSRRQ
jgi:plasmid rolling circle replication initiator protein Rep